MESDVLLGKERMSMIGDELPAETRKDTKGSADLDLNCKLIAASQRGDSSRVSELLLEGAQLVVDQTGTTALHEAAYGGYAEVARVLLDQGFDVNTPDSHGCTALHKAAGKGHLDVIELLINNECDIDVYDSAYGNVPLHEAAWHGFSKSVDLLLRNKSNPFISNRAGCTALHLAAQGGHNQSGRILLYGGCSPDVKNNYGDTPLHTAARYGHAGIARILISAKCSVSEQNKNGDTALHIAAAFKRRKIAKLLVEGGIKTYLKNKQEETAEEIARRKDHLSIMDIIYLGKSEPTGGLKVNHYLSDVTSSSQQSDPIKETQEEVIKDTRKKSSGLVSWIRKRFAKERLQKSKDNQHKVHGEQLRNTENMGLFSQYVKKQGYAYYRDLAGNIRQGPMGYVPHCLCHLNSLHQQHPVNHTDATRQLLNQRIHEIQCLTNQQIHELELATKQRILAEKQECLERMQRHRYDESEAVSRQVAQVEHSLRHDLQTWLHTQMADKNDIPDSNPFGYSIGTKQQRFGDDFDYQRIARYEQALTSNQYLPPPRLFRSRSDETLTHSEYSFHGRAFKSRDAAVEELKTLRQHEEMKEKRRIKLRIGSTEYLNNKTKRSEKDKAELWRSNDMLADESRTKTNIVHGSSVQNLNSDIQDSKNRVVTDTHVKPIDSLQPVTTASSTPKIGEVLKKSDSTPLKSAMRQPKGEIRQVKLFRSNSLPRSSGSEINQSIFNETKKPTKTVRYNETVKAAEISDDLPLKKETDDTRLPVTQREAPIGGHDENYIEQNEKFLHTYHTKVNSPSLPYYTNGSARDYRENNSNQTIVPGDLRKIDQKELRMRANDNTENDARGEQKPLSHLPFTFYSEMHKPFTSTPIYKPVPQNRLDCGPGANGTPQRPLPSYDDIQQQRLKGGLPQPPAYQSVIKGRTAHQSELPVRPLKANSQQCDPYMIRQFGHSGSCSSSNPDSGYGGDKVFNGNVTNNNQSIPAQLKQSFINNKLPDDIRCNRVVFSNMTSDV